MTNRLPEITVFVRPHQSHIWYITFPFLYLTVTVFPVRSNACITALKRSLRRLCFNTCLSFCPRGGGVCSSAWWDAAAPRTSCLTNSPGSEADTPWDHRQVYFPELWMLGDMGNKWAVLFHFLSNVFFIYLKSQQQVVKMIRHWCIYY